VVLLAECNEDANPPFCVSMLNIAALRTLPLSTSADTSDRARCISACTRRARTSSARPYSVNSIPCARRSKSFTPSSCSSLWIERDTADCARNSVAPARLALP
jgi:hypothetical protein